MAPPRWRPKALLLLGLSILIPSVLAFEVPVLDTGSPEIRSISSNLI